MKELVEKIFKYYLNLIKTERVNLAGEELQKYMIGVKIGIEVALRFLNEKGGNNGENCTKTL